MRKIFFLLYFIVFLPVLVSASHFMGGEITWECQSNGQYIFTMKVYRECDGMQFHTTDSLTVINHPSVSYILLTRISQTDISPQCNAMGPHITCAGVTAPNQGGVEEQIYQSAPVTLAGVPPLQGWIFAWGTCCRNPTSNIINATSQNWLLRAVMYSYTPPGSTTPKNANPCFDNSPTFAERHSSVICASSPYTYNHNATDIDLDSLAYAWAPPLSDLNTPVTNWVTGYSYYSPLPDVVHNPNNVPAVVNPFTGEISFTSFTQGAFQTVIQVTAYKCGQKVTEIFREMQITILSCGSNTPPIVSGAFQDTTTGIYNINIDTVFSGELVTFPITISDFETLPGGQQQTIIVTASGAQFGTNYTDTNAGCLNPPCATLNPPPLFSGQLGLQTNFSWQTDCSHLAISPEFEPQTTIYNFIIKAVDDFCPVPGSSIKTITIVVVPRKLPPPLIQNVQLDSNSHIVIDWLPVVDSFNIFNSYRIYYATNYNGPYQLLDTLTDINQSFYIDSTLNSTNLYFYIKTAFGCNNNSSYFFSQSSDTLLFLYTEISDLVKNTSELSHTLYPNPSNKNIVFKFDNSINDNICFRLYDNKGALIFKDDNVKGQRYFLNQNNIKKGIYFYHFYNPQTLSSVNGKLIIVE